MTTSRLSLEKEYEMLRNELLQGRRYVFERPLFILTASFTLMQFVDKQYAMFFPIIIILLLFFNLWFTVNRMTSMARIISFIQLVHENDKIKWIGWESSLRCFRIWLEENKTTIKNIKLDNVPVYDNIAYYPSIFYLHIIVNVLTFIVLTIFTCFNYKPLIVVTTSLTGIVLVIFIIYSIKNSPSTIRPSIEKCRKIWEECLK